MAFLRTFTALTVAAMLWMGLFVEFGEIDSPLLNVLSGWLSPLAVSGWVFYVILCVVCFLLAQRFIGHQRDSNGP